MADHRRDRNRRRRYDRLPLSLARRLTWGLQRMIAIVDKPNREDFMATHLPKAKATVATEAPPRYPLSFERSSGLEMVAGQLFERYKAGEHWPTEGSIAILQFIVGWEKFAATAGPLTRSRLTSLFGRQGEWNGPLRECEFLELIRGIAPSEAGGEWGVEITDAGRSIANGVHPHCSDTRGQWKARTRAEWDAEMKRSASLEAAVAAARKQTPIVPPAPTRKLRAKGVRFQGSDEGECSA